MSAATIEAPIVTKLAEKAEKGAGKSLRFWAPAIVAAMFFVASAVLLVLVNFDVFRSKLPEFHQFFAAGNWLYLAIAIGCEVTATLALRASEGFTKLAPAVRISLKSERNEAIDKATAEALAELCGTSDAPGRLASRWPDGWRSPFHTIRK